MNLVQQTGHWTPQFEEIVRNAIDRRQFQDVTTPGADVEYEVTHNLGFIPLGYLVISQDKPAATYRSITAWTAEKIYLKSNLSTVAARIMVF